MSNCSIIQVRQVPQAATVTGAEWVELDLPPNFSFRTSKDAEGLTDINELLTDSVLPFAVKYSTVNDIALSIWASPAIVDNKTKYLEARIFQQGTQLDYDRIYFRSKNDDAQEWELEVRLRPDHWIEEAKRKKLCTITIDTQTLNSSVETTFWDQPAYVDGGNPVRWWPVDYGGWVDQAEPKQHTDPADKAVFLEDLRPFVSLPYILKQGFCEIGWTLEGLILETAYIRQIWLYLLSRTYYIQSRGLDYSVVGRRKDLGEQLAGDIVLLDEIESDPGAHAENWQISGPGGVTFGAGIKNALPFLCTYKVQFSGYVKAFGNNTEVWFDLTEYGGTGFAGETIISRAYEVKIPTSGNQVYVNFSVDVPIKPDQRVFLECQSSADNGQAARLQPGLRVFVTPNNKSFIRGDLINIGQTIDCDYTLINLLKGFVHAVNGRLITDWSARTVYVLPYSRTDVYGDIVPGYISESDFEDFESITIKNSIRMRPIRNSLTRYTRFEFADTTDAFVQKQNYPQPLFSRLVNNGDDLPDRITPLKNPFFEVTDTRQPGALKQYFNPANGQFLPIPFFPVMTDNTDGARSFAIGPRMVFAYGNVDQVARVNGEQRLAWWYFEGKESGNARFKLPFVAHVRPFELGAFAPTIDATLAYGTHPSDLYVSFWLSYFSSITRGFEVDMLVWLDMIRYGLIDFRKGIRFLFSGTPVIGRMKGIRDFAPCENVPTPVTLTIPPIETTCCDLPCSCKFTTCEYFQDLGQFIQQATLDDLFVSSFKVNGIEQLDSNVDFGIIEIMQVGGRPFVMNLINALNSCGVDYFLFQPTGRSFPNKNDGRWFSIKKPACYTFEIIISDSEGEVYKYTDTEQKQKWFGASWADFGYSGNNYGTPQQCVTTTEY